ncbi:hypothetical protein K1T71_000815 [Dendrolimus kikuchii]|uniref:Uncharacterized protein n=1 Tax=Dendrolimus kikuchii TaxID=765133 RepID=A0ACC1DLE0_9NEOP|nr:hypothetical protein K1T71_000815 [Dendrolimus kikuchii]
MYTSTQNEVLICRGCLSADGKLFSTNTKRLSLDYSVLIGFQIQEHDGLPQYFCYMCSALLRKFIRFRDKCLNSKHLLEDIQSNRVLKSKLKEFIHSNSYYQYTNTQTYEYQPDKDNETEVLFENKDSIKTTIPNVKFKEEIDVSTDIRIKNEDTNFSQNSDLYDSDEQSVVNKYSTSSISNATNEIKSIKDNIESDTSDNQALVTFKSNDKPNTSKKRNTKVQLDVYTKKNLVRNFALDNVNSECTKVSQKEEKRFESKDNLANFENMYNVDVVVLSKEEQMKAVLDRKKGISYLHSPYKCDLCFKGFMDVDNLTKHCMSQHDSSRGLVVCEFCKFRYKDQRSLNQHLKKHRLKFACRQCKYVSRTTFNAKEHHKMHSGQKHECKQCGKSYEKMSSHLSHMRIHHPSDMVWCEYCGESFIGDFGLNAHKKRAHRNLKLPPNAICELCNTNFMNIEALNKHKDRQTKGFCDISCVHCGSGFEARLELRDHLLEVHRSRKKYSCEKCSKTFSKETLYSAHYRRMHADSTQIDRSDKMANWICEVCGKRMPTKCLLVYHQRNHTGERPYQCDECSKSFTMRKLLHSHMRVHTTARPYSCKVCPKTFKGLSALRSHENVHTGLKTKIS